MHKMILVGSMRVTSLCNDYGVLRQIRVKRMRVTTVRVVVDACNHCICVCYDKCVCVFACVCACMCMCVYVCEVRKDRDAIFELCDRFDFIYCDYN